MIIDWITGIAYLAVSGWMGFNVVRALTGRHLLLALAGGWLLGLGAASLGIFWIYLLGGTVSGALPWLQLTLLGLSLAFLSVRRGKADPVTSPARFSVYPAAWMMRLLLAFLCLSVLLQAITSPALRFDEIHNWGFKALSTVVEDRPFQGYWPFMLFPNHVPFAAAGMMSYMQQPLETAAHLIPFLCYVCLLGCFHVAAVEASGRTYWGLPLTCLLAVTVPELMEQGDRLTCDLPLAANLICAVAFALLWLRRGGWGALALSGVAAGLCGWTKTEGLLLTAGVGLGLALAVGVRSGVRKDFWSAAGVWALAAGLTIGPWYVYLQFTDVGLDSSGHLGAFDAERLPVVLAGLGSMLRYKFPAPTLAFLFFLAIGFFKAERGLYLFFLAVVAAGFVHVILPLMMLPGDAFGGWQDFMKHGLERYCLHMAPLMMLSLAAAAREKVYSPFDTLFAWLMGARSSNSKHADGLAK